MPFDPENLRLTDFMDLATLQEIQDNFAAVANVRAIITDADGQVITQMTPTSEFLRRQRVIQQAEDAQANSPQKEGREYVAPIIVNDQRLGTIRMAANGSVTAVDESKIAALSEKYKIDVKQVKGVAQSLLRARNTRPAAIQFLHLLANAIARLCYQEFQLRQRINELTAVYNVATMLADARDLEEMLKRTVQVVAETMNVKASSLRLIDKEQDELVIKAVFNLSPEYLNKGPIRLSTSVIDNVALSPRGFEYVRDMRIRSAHDVSGGCGARRHRFHAFCGNAIQGQTRRRDSRLHRAGADVHAASDRPAQSGRRTSRRRDREYAPGRRAGAKRGARRSRSKSPPKFSSA